MSNSKIYLLVFSMFFVAAGACTNKKLENNIKSLERRVAALEKKAGLTPAATSAANNATAVSSAVPEDQLPVMAFSEMEYDFGTIDEGDIVDYTFTFTNTGKTPLVINKATATCGCTVPKWPKEPIPAGAKGEIEVKFDSKNKPQQQTKYININANTKPEVTRLTIKGFVTPENK